MKQGASYLFNRNTKELKSITKKDILFDFFNCVDIKTLPRDIIADIQKLKMKGFINASAILAEKYSSLSYEDIIYKFPPFQKVKTDLYGFVLQNNTVLIITFLELDKLNKALGISDEERNKNSIIFDRLVRENNLELKGSKENPCFILTMDSRIDYEDIPGVDDLYEVDLDDDIKTCVQIFRDGKAVLFVEYCNYISASKGRPGNPGGYFSKEMGQWYPDDPDPDVIYRSERGDTDIKTYIDFLTHELNDYENLKLDNIKEWLEWEDENISPKDLSVDVDFD